MRKMTALLPLLLTIGCGTVLHGPNDTLFVDSKPSGANASISCDGEFRTAGSTPVKLEFPRKREHCTLRVERAGSQTKSIELDHGYSRRFWWNFAPIPAGILIDGAGNSGMDFGYGMLLAPFVTGLNFLVDHVSGSKHDYDPREVVVELEPAP